MMSGEIRNPIEDVIDLTANQPQELEEFPSEPKKKLYTCDLCNIHVTSSNVLRRHKEGRKHLMRVERQGKTFECDVCQITANSQSQLDAHLKSSKHRTRLLKKEQAVQIMHKGVWLIIFSVICIFIALLMLFKHI